jgi:hypothetical protein
MDEGRKRVIGIMAAIMASLHMKTADDLFGNPQGSPRTMGSLPPAFNGRKESCRRLMKCVHEKAPVVAFLPAIPFYLRS